jgi:ribosomal protein S18 acetylase RimI-like enzyme
MDQGYQLSDEIPSAEDYLRLRRVSGLSPKSAEGAAIGLPRSIFGVVVRNGSEVVGMGRVVGDGGLMLQVTDIAVEPAHQGRGLGKAIMARIAAFLEENLPDGDSAYPTSAGLRMAVSETDIPSEKAATPRRMTFTARPLSQMTGLPPVTAIVAPET